MGTTGQPECRIRFKPFELNLATRELFQNGLKVRLTGHSLDILCLLLEQPGAVVSRDVLRKKLWPEDTFGDFEHGLNVTMSRLRKALCDQAEEPQLIETIPRVGYRFIGVVEVPQNGSGPCMPETGVAALAEAAANPIAQDEPQFSTEAASVRNGWALPILGTTASLVIVAAVFLLLYRPSRPPQVTSYVRIARDSYGKSMVGSDGTNLFFNRPDSPNPVSKVAISGGAVTRIPVHLASSQILDVSPDGSRLLVNDVADNSIWIVRVADGALRHVTTGKAIAGAWSPDGKAIAFNTPDGDLFRVGSDGTGLRKLTSLPDHTSLPQLRLVAWSPDGKTIQFTRDLKLWEIAADGSDLHLLLPHWHPSAGQCCGRWTPDGKYFIFLSFAPRSAAGPVPGAQLYLLDERHTLLGKSSRNPVQLTSPPIRWGRPVLMRDDKTILARGIVLHGQLDRYDPRSEKLQPFLDGISAEFVAFSPDGNSVVYVTFPEGILWKANRDGSHPVQLTDPPRYPKLPRWSPDGSQILFVDTDRNGLPRAYIMPSAGGVPAPLLPEAAGPQFDADWSPDGKRVVFDSLETANGETTRIIRVLNRVTHQILTIKGSQDGRSPRWSPNGRFIAGLFGRLGELRVFDFESQRWTVLRKEWTEFPFWSRDSRFLYFVGRADELGVYRVRPTGGAAKMVLDLEKTRITGDYEPWVGLDPDDNFILLRESGSDDIYALTLEPK